MLTSSATKERPTGTNTTNSMDRRRGLKIKVISILILTRIFSSVIETWYIKHRGNYCFVRLAKVVKLRIAATCSRILNFTQNNRVTRTTVKSIYILLIVLNPSVCLVVAVCHSYSNCKIQGQLPWNLFQSEQHILYLYRHFAYVSDMLIYEICRR
jgi:hypothetical protein